MDIAKYTLDVGSDPVVPDSQGRPTALKDFTGWQVASPANGTSCCILWNVTTSCSSMHLWCKLVGNPSVTFGFDGQTPPLELMFTPTTTLFAPCVQASDIQISLVEDFDQQSLIRGRIVSGELRVISESTSTTTTSISGSISAGILTDTRISQTINPFTGSGNFSGFDPTPSTLQQMSLNKKDTITNIPVQRGVSVIVGVDQAATLDAFDRTVIYDGQLDSNVYGVGGIDMSGTSPNGWSYNASLAGGVEPIVWFSPYGSVGVTANVGALFFNWVPKIGFEEAPIYRVTYELGPGALGSTPCTISMCHLFLSVDPTISSGTNGVITPVSETKTVSAGNFSGVTSDNRNRGYVEFSPVLLNNSIWIGSTLQAYCPNTGTTAYINIKTVLFRSNRSFAPGVFGPTAVVRVDNLASGQVLNITARYTVEYEPGARVIPYLASSATNLQIANPDSMRLLRMLYSGPSRLFKRVWALDDHDKLKKDLAQVTPSRMLAMSGNDPLVAELLGLKL